MLKTCNSRGCLLVALWLGAVPAGRAESPTHPLEPPDMSSPRSTLSAFVAFINEAYAFGVQEGRTHRSAARRAEKTQELLRFLDLRGVAPSLRVSMGRESAACLKEALDRIELPPWSEIPDAAAIAALPSAPLRWTVPHTEITLTRITEGPREGQYVFGAETVERAHEFYRRVKDLPYKPGATEGAYEAYVGSPGWMIPARLVHGLPGWMRTRPGGQAVWQWVGLAGALLVAMPLMLLLYRTGQRWSKRRRGARYFLGWAFPVLAMIVPSLAKRFIADQVVVTGRVLAVTEFGLNLLSMGALVYVILSAANRVATAVVRSRWVHLGAVEPDLVRLAVRVCGVIASLMVFLEGGRFWGLSLTTLIAGASVSGLAVALAAQDSLKNVFGGLMILLDKPFREGERIRAKGYEGVVEDIGLRSTRLRADNGHLVSMSNEEIARLDIENISRRPYLRRHEAIRLRGDTPPEKVQQAAEIVRRLLEKHEGMDPHFPPQVRIGALDSVGVAITMTYWYHPPKTVQFAAFNEQVNVRVLEEFQAEGIRLA